MKNKTALMTGASRGIGLHIAERLKEAGARLVAPTRNEMDLLSNESIDAYLNSLREQVDILINNAGINRLGGSCEISDRDIEETLQINLIGPVRLIKRVAPQMIERNYGRIVNISSIWSAVSKPRRVTYSASKSGLNGLTRAVAVELAPFNILVNSVAPGYVNTELTRQNNSEEEISIIRKSIPMQRLAQPEEIAELVCFLCSERNTYITGQTIVIDGGFTCQ
jgi:NAD(P)-dependent dehydrogenase (short-subunit alcohol dehydrogenase family)